MADAPSSGDGPSQRAKPRRAWWQWVLGLGLIGFFVFSYGVRWIQQHRPQWLVNMAAAETVPLRVPEGVREADRIPASSGDFAGANVLLITLDTTRGDRLGFYGNDEIATPAIDALAKRGVFFSRAISPAPTTLPAHSSIMTGLFTFHHGARKNGSTRLSEDHTTLAEVLKGAGYATCAVVSAIVLEAHFGVSQGFDEYHDQVSDFPDAPKRRVPERHGKETTDIALDWLSRRGPGPFFLWVHYYDPHSPYEPPPPFSEEYKTNLYDGELAFVDSQVARLTDYLQEHALTDKTLVVAIGDHGEGLGQHGEWAHGIMLYDPTLHVPFIMSCGNRLGGGVYISKQVCSVDLTPTILSLLGIAMPVKCDGVDLTRPWSPETRLIYGDTMEGFNQYGLSPLLCVRDGENKYIFGPAPELYDIEHDPDETRDLSGDVPAETESMKGRLQQHFGSDLEAACFMQTNEQVGYDARQKLAALGYIDVGLTSRPPLASLPDPKAVIDLVNQIELAVSITTPEERPEAIKKLEDLAQEYPDFYAAHKYLADMYYREGEFFMAQVSVERCLELYPGEPTNLLFSARIHTALKEYDEAVAAYRATIEAAADRYTPLFELGRLFLQRGRPIEAADHLESAFLLRPTEDVIVEDLVSALQKSSRGHEALPLLEGRLQSQPDLVRLRVAVARLYIEAGKRAAAVALLRQGLRRQPDEPEFANALAITIMGDPLEMGDSHGEIVELMEGACRRTDEKELRYLRTLSAVYVKLGRMADAIVASRKALALAQAANNVAVVEAITRDIESLERDGS